MGSVAKPKAPPAAPDAEITVFPWKEPPELKARTINRVRTFLKRH